MISLKNSIRARLILILTTFLIIFVAINMFMNMFFLERYYTYRRRMFSETYIKKYAE